ncbi:MAG: 5'-methylthioadenosine/adenosylhomocysteine nucleosidase [Clostridia bacterium]|nr:5'-methylthioadenosine/adenosylhomocysteine nucleosidase [Clostridia bacterium]
MIGIIGAMPVEVDKFKNQMLGVSSETISGTEFVCGTLWGHPAVVAVSGVGKVNAAICTQAMITRYEPRFIINSGVAGGLDPELNICDTVVATSVIQHDMDTTPLGDPIGFISGLGVVDIPADNELSEKLHQAALKNGVHSILGKIVSGDQFINSHEKKDFLKSTFDASACEMESAAIGHVCFKNEVPFAILRSISDNADDSSHLSFNEFVEIAADNLEKVMKTFFENI